MSDIMQPHAGAIGKAGARAQIDRWLIEYAEGISDRRVEAVGLATQAELDAGVVEARFARADKLRAAAIAARRGADHAKELDAAIARRATPEEGGTITKRRDLSGPEPEAFFSKRAQPTDAAQPEPEAEPPEADAPQDGAQGAAEPQWSSPLLEVAFAAAGPDNDVNPAVLSASAPYDNARAFVRRCCHEDGALSLYRWRDEWWEWNGLTYTKLAEAELRSRAYGFLDTSVKRDGKEGELARFRPTPKNTNDLLDGVRSGLMLPGQYYPPLRLDTGERLGAVMGFANGLFDLRTGKLVKPTPAHWLHHEVNYPLLFGARCPEWLAFLERAFPGDPDAHALIEEALGLSMTEDVSLQKGFLLVGYRRSGKGTILKLLEALIGSSAYATVDFNTWFKTENSQEGLIDKRAIVVPDLRLPQGKWYGQNYDAGGLDQKSVERLLKITAGDTVDVPCKWQGKPWRGVLVGKSWIASNKVPNFNDATLLTRYVKLWFGQSYADREDIELGAKLLAELPGIAGRCIQAYARLRARKRFIQPASSARLETDARHQSDPFTQWVEEALVADDNGQVKIRAAFSRFELWCETHGHRDLLKHITDKNIRTSLRQVPGFERVSSFRPEGETSSSGHTSASARRKIAKPGSRRGIKEHGSSAPIEPIDPGRNLELDDRFLFL